MPDAVSCGSGTCGRDGRRTRTTWWDGFYVTNDRLVTGELVAVRENGAASGLGVLATYAYDNLGRRTSLTRGNGTVTSTTYDPVSRLATLAENVTGSTNDQTATFSYNPDHQIGAVTKTNDTYAWTGHGSGSTASVANGLNQLTSIGGAATMHERGNLTYDPTNGLTFTYSSENLLKVSGGTTLHYDPLLRLVEYDTTISRRFVYDGVEIAAEVDNPAGAILQRFIRGDGADELIAIYTGSGTANRSWAHADERGSIVAQSDGGGNVTSINRYDEFGKPQASNVGRFQYTGQMWLPETGAYYYKARNYAPHLGRFLQTDPIEYEGGLNLYAYVGNDPVNWTDPLGLDGTIVVTGPHTPHYGDEYSDTGGGLSGIGIGSAQIGALVSGFSTLPPIVPEDVNQGADVTVICNPVCQAFLNRRQSSGGLLHLAGQRGRGGKQNVIHTHHQGLSTEELQRRYNDPKTPAAERAKIRQTLKGRGVINFRKRLNRGLPRGGHAVGPLLWACLISPDVCDAVFGSDDEINYD